MKAEICVFAGTTEGRRLCETLAAWGVKVYACTATEYGGTLLEENPQIQVSSQRLDLAQMEQLFRDARFRYVVDATHPYAPLVTANVKQACESTHTPYLRLLREEEHIPAHAVYVENTQAAVAFLQATPGNILLTTGSKELPAYREIPDFSQRVFARVLPVESSIAACREAGLPAAHILAMQGPFSLEMNLAMLRATAAEILVTKESGSTGGFEEKALAAAQTGARLLVIGRPPQVEGLGYEKLLVKLRETLNPRVQVKIVGIGSGKPEERTIAAQRAIETAQCLIGASRMLDAAPEEKTKIAAIAPEKIAQAIATHPEYRQFAVLMSGDVGFFSGTKKLLPLLKDYEVELIPGLSSLVCLCARLGVSYEDVLPFSLHGREGNLIAALRQSSRVFTLVGGQAGMKKLCESLVSAGMGDARISVGERLGYPQEKITRGSAQSLQGQDFDSLSVALVEYKLPEPVTHGLPDEAFQRGCHENGSVVPMTKREIRAVALSLLGLRRDSVCYDIGAGTGSVSIEMALQASAGQVFAIEQKPDAVALLAENKRKFHVENLEIISGSAPEALEALPAPTHAFIGGSSGNMREILAILQEKNPQVRVVAAAIALETVAELTALAKEFPGAEITCLTVSRGRKLGAYHLMTGQNPVYLFSFGG